MFVLVENGIAKTRLLCLKGSDICIINAIELLLEDVKAVSGAVLPYEEIEAENLINYKGSVFFATFTQMPELKSLFEEEYNQLLGTDGFAVKLYQEKIFIIAHNPQGVYFGAFDFLEKATPIIWSRSAKEMQRAFVPSKDIVAKKCDYIEKPDFLTRGWNNCYILPNTEDSQLGTMICFSKNKINMKLGAYSETYTEYALKPFASVLSGVFCIDEEIPNHPDYFMVDFDGTPKTAHAGVESFINYYNPCVAEYMADRIIQKIRETSFALKYKEIYFPIPDNPHFQMIQNGVKLHELPFTTDDGNVVYPQEKNYKATVFYNYLNRVIQKIEKVYPDFTYSTLAYLYCEECPKTQIHKKLCVAICPINGDDHLPYADDTSSATQLMLDNVKAWRKMTDKVYLYNYWYSFKGNIYSRPLAKVVQKNLKLYRDLGIMHLCPEGRMDNGKVLRQDEFFDLNEMYYWQVNRLFWNADEDLEASTKRFCDIVYGNASEQMQTYFALIQKGWDESKGFVFYPTGGDVYIRKFIIEAGVADAVLESLRAALKQSITEIQRQKISSIYKVMKKQIEMYSKLENEEATAIYTKIGKERILSDEMLNITENPQSVWNKCIPLKIFKDYDTLEDYSKEAQLAVRMLYDDTHIYISFTVYDKDIVSQKVEYNEVDNLPVVYRKEGQRLLSYVETYIGGNVLNMSRYYGFITGYVHELAQRNVYVNDGSPICINEPKDFQESFYVHWDENAEKRYYAHVQAIPFECLDVSIKDAKPYGSFVYFSDKYGRVGWKGNGLWNKEGFCPFQLKK